MGGESLHEQEYFLSTRFAHEQHDAAQSYAIFKKALKCVLIGKIYLSERDG